MSNTPKHIIHKKDPMNYICKVSLINIIYYYLNDLEKSLFKSFVFKQEVNCSIQNICITRLVQPISYHWSFSITPGNLRKLEGFFFYINIYKRRTLKKKKKAALALQCLMVSCCYLLKDTMILKKVLPSSTKR